MAVSLRPGPPLRFVTPSMTPGLRRYIDNEASSAAVLLAASLVALVWVNSPWSESYHHLWELPVRLAIGDGVFEMDLHHFVNDAAMAIFFMAIMSVSIWTCGVTMVGFVVTVRNWYGLILV